MNKEKRSELEREAVFKDSVLSSAETRSIEIVTAATKKMDAELKLVRLRYENISYETIVQRYSLDSEREFSEETQAARKDLLQYRALLVQEIFENVKQNLVQFTTKKEYVVFLQKKLQKHLPLKKDEKAPAVYLRKEDMCFEQDLKKDLPNCEVLQEDAIVIGGLKLKNGHIMHDETLDTMLRDEREHFINNKELTV